MGLYECSEAGAVVQAAAAGSLDLGQILMAMPRHHGGPPECLPIPNSPLAFPVHYLSSPLSPSYGVAESRVLGSRIVV